MTPGIVHRDIKPQNLLLTKDGSRLLITDFGLARDEEASRLTLRGDFMGTIRYMSPEQLLAQRAKVDHRSDIWSIGVSLYEAVTLDLPYSAASEEAYIGAVSLKEPIPAKKRQPAVPWDLETVLMKCLERDPERRYRSAAELRDDLRRCMEDRPVLARRPGLLTKASRFLKRHRKVILAAASATVLVLTVLAIAIKVHTERTDLDRIHWTLEQVIQSRKDPASLQPDWARLEKNSTRRFGRNPPVLWHCWRKGHR